MAIITVFMILLLAFVMQGAYVEWPQNTVSTAGSNVTIKCSSDQRGCNGVEWLKRVRDTPVFIYKNTIFNDFQQRYRVDNSSGCNLVITNVQLEDAGRFLCTIFMNQTSQERGATLIVLKSQPKCSVNVSEDNMAAEGDGVSFMCEVTYNGTNMASVTWQGLEDKTPVVQHGETISHSYSVVAHAPLVPAYSCVISFNVTSNPNESAGSMPVVSCATLNHTVFYLGKNVTLNPFSTTYSSESLIRCSADGNPSPTYKWQKLRDDNVTWIDIHDGPEFDTSNAASSQYRCAASNTVKGVNRIAYSHTFWLTSSDGEPVSWLILGIAGIAAVGVLFLLILITICFCARSCPGYKCCHSDKKSIDSSRTHDIQPLQETVYSNVNNGDKLSGKTANPRPLPSVHDPPKRPQVAPPPQPKPRKGGQNNKYDEPDELTYACLAGEQDPRRHRNVPNLIEETEYAGICSA